MFKCKESEIKFVQKRCIIQLQYPFNESTLLMAAVTEMLQLSDNMQQLKAPTEQKL